MPQTCGDMVVQGGAGGRSMAAVHGPVGSVIFEGTISSMTETLILVKTIWTSKCPAIYSE